MQANKYITYGFVGLDNNKMNTMHSTYIKVTDTQQAIMYNISENTKLKLQKKRTPPSGTKKYENRNK